MTSLAPLPPQPGSSPRPENTSQQPREWADAAPLHREHFLRLYFWKRSHLESPNASERVRDLLRQQPGVSNRVSRWRIDCLSTCRRVSVVNVAPTDEERLNRYAKARQRFFLRGPLPLHQRDHAHRQHHQVKSGRQVEMLVHIQCNHQHVAHNPEPPVLHQLA